MAAGEVLGSRFLLREVLGYGATGTVFAALDTVVGEKVAIKLLHPDLHDQVTKERLQREVRASRPGHPNSVTVYDLHESDGHVYLSMELVDGTTLSDLLKERRRLDPEEVVAISGQIVAALGHLRERGIVHRDVKPGNILITADGVAKLCDMGLARPLDHGTTLTATEMVVGTPAYMAPEQGTATELTSASDIYALGLTMYRSLTGTVPITAETAVATLTRRQRERAPTIRSSCPDCPRWLARLVRWMLEPRPGDRPTAAQVVKALEKRRVRPRPRRRTLAAFAVGAVFMVGGTVLGLHSGTVKTARVEYDDSSVFGLDTSGGTTWTRALPNPPLFTDSGDVDHDGREDLVIAGVPEVDREGRLSEEERSYVVAVSRDGRILTRVVPEDLIGSWHYPFRVELVPVPQVADLDGDGWNEIVVACRHRGFFPASVLVFWPRWKVWDVLLDHPGTIQAIAAADEDGRPGLRFVGMNNLLGMARVYGEVDLVPPGLRPDPERHVPPLFSPPDFPGEDTEAASWRAYVPFAAGETNPPSGEAITLQLTPEKIIALATRGPSFDAFFNPLPGPNQGKDLRLERLRFATSLRDLAPGTGPITFQGVRAVLGRISEEAGPLMKEPAYEIILSVLGAKAIAAAGDLAGGIQLLEETGARLYDEDLFYRLAHFQALAGDFEKSKETVRYAIDTGKKTRSRYDAPLLLLKIAIQSHDAGEAAAAIQFLTARGYLRPIQRAFQHSLMARVRLWWDEPTEADCHVATVDLDADGDAVGCLARWRLGRSEPDDVELMRSSIARNPDSEKLGTVALAAALLESGRANEAIHELDSLIPDLTRSAKWDFGDARVLKLAQSLRIVALWAAGNVHEAEAEALELGPRFDSNLLPGILVAEVLRHANG